MRFEKRPSKKSKSGYTWRVIIDYKDVYGRKQRYTKSGFPTKKAAEKHGIEMENELSSGGVLGQKEKTVSVCWSEWLQFESEQYKPSTIDHYNHCFYSQIEPKLGKIPVRELTYVQLQTFVDEFPWKDKSFVKGLLSNLFRYCMKAGYITSNPVREIYAPRAAKEERDEYISFHVLQRIVKICESNKRVSEFQRQSRPVILYIGYYAGLRIGEILGLKFSDIDWRKKTMTISRSVNSRGELTNDLKTPASRATIPVHDTLLKILAEWKKVNPFDLIVPNDNGDPLLPSTITSYLSTLCKKHGIDFYPHMLRHTFATNLHAAGVDQITATKLTRHSRVDVLADIYTHPQMETTRKALNATFGKKSRKE